MTVDMTYKALNHMDYAGEFLDMYGSSITVNTASNITGISQPVLLEMAKILEFSFAKETNQPRGYEHLPGLPANTVVHKWKHGTKYYTEVKQPGYIALTVHNSAFPQEDKAVNDD